MKGDQFDRIGADPSITRVACQILLTERLTIYRKRCAQKKLPISLTFAFDGVSPTRSSSRCQLSFSAHHRRLLIFFYHHFTDPTYHRLDTIHRWTLLTSRWYSQVKKLMCLSRIFLFSTVHLVSAGLFVWRDDFGSTSFNGQCRMFQSLFFFSFESTSLPSTNKDGMPPRRSRLLERWGLGAKRIDNNISFE